MHPSASHFDQPTAIKHLNIIDISSQLANRGEESYDHIHKNLIAEIIACMQLPIGNKPTLGFFLIFSVPEPQVRPTYIVFSLLW